MSLILNIDTALDKASVGISSGGRLLQLALNENRNDHAAWLHNAVKDILQQAGISLQELQAIAVSIGPGSYTGLRVGLSAAKGFCYALGIPLLAINTLEIMALAVEKEAEDLICPLIDARRMEVFTAVYSTKREVLLPPQAMIISPESFREFLQIRPVLFCGTGSQKLSALLSSPKAKFSPTGHTAEELGRLSAEKFKQADFTEPAYAEPLYIKEFYSSPGKSQP
jgi:tRNA threonylcarbamoyladenosine biosynthesis protein TsaB